MLTASGSTWRPSCAATSSGDRWTRRPSCAKSPRTPSSARCAPDPAPPQVAYTRRLRTEPHIWNSTGHHGGRPYHSLALYVLCVIPRQQVLTLSPPNQQRLKSEPGCETGAQVKLLAEPWDCGMYQVGSFPNWDVWGEWNGKFRDDFRRAACPATSLYTSFQRHCSAHECLLSACRRFIKGDAGMKKAIATRIAGSADLYQRNNRCGNTHRSFRHKLAAQVVMLPVSWCSANRRSSYQ